VTAVVWLGTAAPTRSARWLEGALWAGAKLDGAIALAAGEPDWLDLAAACASRFGLASAGIPTPLHLDYLGWAQIVAAAVRHLGATLVIVDEASRPERFAEVAAIAEILDAAQLTRAIALARDAPDSGTLRVTRNAGQTVQTVRLTAPAVVGVRIASAPRDANGDLPNGKPSSAMTRLELATLGLDPLVLGHRAVPPPGNPQPRKTIDRIVEHLAVHLVTPITRAGGG
jgi:electron transfer flavoprotein alpha/beta subunit